MVVMMFRNETSITKMIVAKITEATITKMALLCNWFHDGQETLYTNSLYDSRIYAFIFLICTCLSFDNTPLEACFVLSGLPLLCNLGRCGRGRAIRTPINGFGDRYSTLELCPSNIKC